MKQYYALDTNIVSFWLKGIKGVGAQLEMAVNKDAMIVIPPIVYYEVMKWLIPNNAQKKIASFKSLCAHNGIADIEEEDLENALSLYADLRKQGITIGDSDILIAAYCLRNDLTLVTNNTKHFEHINGLDMEDWSATEP
jgi:predicted nucleic acid-binding protein